MMLQAECGNREQLKATATELQALGVPRTQEVAD